MQRKRRIHEEPVVGSSWRLPRRCERLLTALDRSTLTNNLPVPPANPPTRYFPIWENKVAENLTLLLSVGMDLAVNTLRALADPMRLRIVHLLMGHAELCVCQISAVLGLNYAALSKHLQMLKLVGLVADDKRGRWVYYRLSKESWNPTVNRLILCVQDLVEMDPSLFEKDNVDAKRVACCSLSEVARLGPAFLRGRRLTQTGEKR